MKWEEYIVFNAVIIVDSFSEWLMQLIGESIGKENLGGYSIGLTLSNTWTKICTLKCNSF